MTIKTRRRFRRLFNHLRAAMIAPLGLLAILGGAVAAAFLFLLGALAALPWFNPTTAKQEEHLL